MLKKKMQSIKLNPHLQERIWGGSRLKEYGFETSDVHPLGEAWTVSAHSVGQSVVSEGEFSGVLFEDLWKEHPELFGVDTTNSFPLLIKWIDAADDLSVQVHPNDRQAQERENVPYGKTECWYIVDCEENAEIIFGHQANTHEELTNLISNQQWDDVLLRKRVKKGDFFFVPAGTVHALTKGVVVLEIQQSSDTTYRLYDYEREDDSGQKRPLHIEDSLAVTTVPHVEVQERYIVIEEDGAKRKQLTSNNYFAVEEVIMSGKWEYESKQYTFLSMISGEIKINGGTVKAPETHFLPVNSIFDITGEGSFLLSTPPNEEKEKVHLSISQKHSSLDVSAIKENGTIICQWKMMIDDQIVSMTMVEQMFKLCREAQKSFNVQSIGMDVSVLKDESIRKLFQTEFGSPIVVEADNEEAL
ncbi:type I phosphomannose isomerase catalytic subunit [Bacillus sp. JJ722]|uniref:type I phosphomannose isomerase catalytic subunit n=1 Tax=Bacillus sp. JJ722 TaxID=3122973 RepID=UPI002FFD7B9A